MVDRSCLSIEQSDIRTEATMSRIGTSWYACGRILGNPVHHFYRVRHGNACGSRTGCIAQPDYAADRL